MSDLKASPLIDSQNDPLRPITGTIFYGWWIVLAGTVILFVSSGIGFYGHGVILDPLRNLHGWPKVTISSAVTLYFFTSGIMGMIIGRQIDTYGPKWFLILGAVIIGTGFVLLSHIDTVWQLFVIYFIMALGFSCTSLVPVNTLITNWFIRKRGFAMSLTNTGLSAGGIVMVPLASYIISHWGLAVALPVLGAVYCAVVVAATSFVKQRPSDLKQFPDGEPPELRAAGKHSAVLSYSLQMRVWSRSQAIRTVSFWSIVIAFLLALAGQIAFLVHQVSFLSQYLGVSGAATAVSITAGASIVGRLWLGTIVDRLDKRHVIMVCFLIQGIAVITLAHFHHTAILYLGTFAFGLTMGNIIMMQSLITAECFGLVSFATVSGLAGVFTMSGAAFGPTIAGLIFDATGSYRAAFTIFAAMSAIAILVIYFAKPSEPNETEPKINQRPPRKLGV
ncbi:MAG: MFS transporter [Desulfobacterales bacterium]|nr:MAG: MFS transporter [Desulfobacterales bacterium]